MKDAKASFLYDKVVFILLIKIFVNVKIDLYSRGVNL